MLLGYMVNMLVANRYVLFQDGEKIGEYKYLEDVPNEYKSCFVKEIMSPTSTAFHNAVGDMFISIY